MSVQLPILSLEAMRGAAGGCGELERREAEGLLLRVGSAEGLEWVCEGFEAWRCRRAKEKARYFRGALEVLERL